MEIRFSFTPKRTDRCKECGSYEPTNAVDLCDYCHKRQQEFIKKYKGSGWSGNYKNYHKEKEISRSHIDVLEFLEGR
jgi:hypothetical protein